MGTTKRPRARYSVEKVVADLAQREWNDTDLARATGLSNMTISRFMRGDTQTPKVAGKIARALGFSVKRYYSHVEAA